MTALDEALLRQALEAIETTLSGADYDSPYSALKAAAAAIRTRLNDDHAINPNNRCGNFLLTRVQSH